MVTSSIVETFNLMGSCSLTYRTLWRCSEVTQSYITLSKVTSYVHGIYSNLLMTTVRTETKHIGDEVLYENIDSYPTFMHEYLKRPRLRMN